MENRIPTIIIASVFVVIGGLLFVGIDEGDSVNLPMSSSINELEIALGLEPNYLIVDKFGRNPDVDTGYEDIWNDGGVITFLSSPSTLTVTTTGNDNGASSTGARIITIEGLDENWNTQSANVTTNASVPQTTSENWLRVNRAYVAEAGTLLTNENDVIITATTGGSIQAHILADEGQTMKTQYTIPIGFTGYLVHGVVSTDSGQHIEAQLMTKEPNGAWRVKHSVTLDNAHDVFDMIGSEPLPEKTDESQRKFD